MSYMHMILLMGQTGVDIRRQFTALHIGPYVRHVKPIWNIVIFSQYLQHIMFLLGSFSSFVTFCLPNFTSILQSTLLPPNPPGINSSSTYQCILHLPILPVAFIPDLKYKRFGQQLRSSHVHHRGKNMIHTQQSTFNVFYSKHRTPF